MFKEIIHYGTALEKNTIPSIPSPVVTIPGKGPAGADNVPLDYDILSKHLMLIGGTGTGKSNTFYYIVEDIKKRLGKNDVMIVFDTKGDYLSRFYNPNTDFVLSPNSEQTTVTWNIFREITVDGFEEDKVYANLTEISWGLFSESIAKNSNNPFFPNAARDLFVSIVFCLYRRARSSVELMKKYLDNAYLRRFMDGLTVAEIKNLVGKYPDQASVMTYIGDGNNTQGLGVLAEMQTVVRKVFVESFAKKGNFSMTKLLRIRDAHTLFIEYSLTRGASLIPIYKLLIDIALKESMGAYARDLQEKGIPANVYVVCDEFKLLPDLMHIDDALNFGRGLGVKVIAGLQSIDQLTANYGEARAKNIIAGFSSLISFRSNDEATRRFIVGRYGKNYLLECDRNAAYSEGSYQSHRIADVVEDWDISSLDVGQAVVGLLNHPPFSFTFDEYNR